jgi:hopanoid biosynthesis associated RND transporter like protein HpnN
MNGRSANSEELRGFLEVHPIVDYNVFEPGKKAADAIRQAATDLNLASEYGATVRLTGPIPLADEEYAAFSRSAPTDISITAVAVVIIVWLALRSARLVLACLISLLVGLAVTLALGLMLAGALNLISIAFFVLFIGIGVDFGIQFSVRYRAERHEVDDLRTALRNTGNKIGAQLSLAAAAVALGFFSFLPTDCRGLSELGLIAGVGMIVALVTSVTLLPALISLLNPPAEPRALGYGWLAPVDRAMERHRIPIVAGTLMVAVIAAPLLYFLQFDFNLMNMRSTQAESVATYFELKSDANTGIDSIHVLAPSLWQADKQAQRFSELPSVKRTMTLSSLVPEAQDEKLYLIRKAATALNPSINSRRSRASAALSASARLSRPPPDDAENIHFLDRTARALQQAANEEKGSSAAAAWRLADLLSRLAKSDAVVRARAAAAFVSPLNIVLDELRNSLAARPITSTTLPPDLKRDWIAENGRVLVEVFPTGDPNDNEVLRNFADAILAIEPTAAGTPILLHESRRTVVRAFVEAGCWALASITILLWIVLRRFTDVLLTLVPLVLAGLVTLEICVVIGLPLNFANIIALPLLLGVGVAFKIYYVMAWRAGQTNLLQSSLTHAVFFSAMATATAFGSLSLSHHPGMASMGKLLVLSLLTTFAAAVLFQPVLMGPPRNKKQALATTP